MKTMGRIDGKAMGLVIGWLLSAACSGVSPPANVAPAQPAKHLATRPPQSWEACTPESDPRNPEARRYLEGLFLRLSEANPEIFTGFYSPEKFCLTVPDEATPYAGPGTGAIVFGLDFMLSRHSDAQVALVLAHEAAHILLDHREPAEPSREFPASPEWDAYRSDATWLRYAAALQKAEEASDAYQQAEYVRMDQMAQAGLELQSVFAQWRGLTLTPDQRRRFQDVEATVQFGFDYLFSDSRFTGLMEELLSAGEHKDSALLRRYQELRAAKIEPPLAEVAALEQQASELRAQVAAIEEQSPERLRECEEELASVTDWEADALAFGLVLRAGFDAGVQTIAMLSSDEATRTFEQSCQQAQALAARAPRGSDRFPKHDPCFRVYHLLLLEVEEHGDLYAPSLEAPGLVDLPAGGLAGLRTSLSPGTSTARF